LAGRNGSYAVAPSRAAVSHLLLAARGVAGETFAAFTQPREIAIDLVEILRDAGTVTTSGEGAGQEVLLDGKMDEAVAALHHLDKAATDNLRRRKTIDALAGEFYTALGDVTPLRAQQVGNRLERRGLAGAVGSEKSNNAPLGYRQRHATQHQDNVIVDHLHVVDCKQCRRSHRDDPSLNLISSPWRNHAA
jgi:hypothetical protein